MTIGDTNAAPEIVDVTFPLAWRLRGLASARGTYLLLPFALTEFLGADSLASEKMVCALLIVVLAQLAARMIRIAATALALLLTTALIPRWPLSFPTVFDALWPTIPFAVLAAFTVYACARYHGCRMAAGNASVQGSRIVRPAPRLTTDERFPSDQLLARLVITSGVVLLLIAQAGRLLQIRELLPRMIIGLAGVALLYWGARLLQRARQRAVLVRPVESSPSSPYAIILRSFGDDMKIYTEKAGEGVIATLMDLYKPTLEQALGQYLGAFGSVVSLEDPTAPVPTLGAPRFHSDDERWTDQIIRWMTAADTIVALPADAKCLAWELSQIEQLDLWGKLLIVFPDLPQRDLRHRLDAISDRISGLRALQLTDDMLDRALLLSLRGERPTLFVSRRRSDLFYEEAIWAEWSRWTSSPAYRAPTDCVSNGLEPIQ
jgi:hypothetical protein